MAKLTAAVRKKIPAKDFAVPSTRSKSGGKGGYPIEDESHARDALSRSSGKAVHAQIERKVHAKYPDMKIGHAGGAKGKSKDEIDRWARGKK